MMTQSVMTQTANLFGNAAVNVTSKSKQTGTGFDKIISNNIKVTKKISDDPTTVKKAPTQKSDAADNKKSDDTNSISDQADKASTKAVKATKNTKEDSSTTKETDSSSKTDNVKSTKDDGTAVDEQLLTNIQSMLQSIQEQVMKTLNLSPEDFNKLLDGQGMSVTDLLQPENLQKLVLAGNGQTNLLAVLTNENLAKQMNELLQNVEDIKSNANLNLTDEQLKSVLEQLKDKSQVAGQPETNPTATDTNVKVVENITKQPEAVNSISTSKQDDNSVNNSDNAHNKSESTAQTSVASENNSGTQKDNGRQEHKELKDTDHFQVFVDNLVKSTKDTQVNFAGNITQSTVLKDIANQIIEKIKVSVTTDQSSMELQLNPENLGKVNLSIQSKNGVMTAQFVVQNEISKEAIEGQLHTLRETLTNQGIKVDAIEVSVASYTFNQNNQEQSQNQSDSQNKGSDKKITLDDAFSMNEDLVEDSVTDSLSGTQGNQIDYTA